jgi:hypothetical protein
MEESADEVCRGLGRTRWRRRRDGERTDGVEEVVRAAEGWRTAW